MGCNLERNRHFQIGIPQDLIHAYYIGFHHEKGHIYFEQLGISALGHQLLRWVTYVIVFSATITYRTISIPNTKQDTFTLGACEKRK